MAVVKEGRIKTLERKILERKTLERCKVVLREKHIGDARNDYEWRCDPELARFDAALPLRMSFQEFLAAYSEELKYPSRWQHRFAIETLEKKHIGNCTYYDIDRTRRDAELGIIIGDKAYWNNGYGTDAVIILVNHIFSETNLQEIYLHTLDWNVRAQKCFQKCGFVPYGCVIRSRSNFLIMKLHRHRFDGIYLSHVHPGAGIQHSPRNKRGIIGSKE
jgi:RimJ/RimL family protein N-acetyltransferase